MKIWKLPNIARFSCINVLPVGEQLKIVFLLFFCHQLDQLKLLFSRSLKQQKLAYNQKIVKKIYKNVGLCQSDLFIFHQY
jgi:hypothetical protein